MARIHTHPPTEPCTDTQTQNLLTLHTHLYLYLQFMRYVKVNKVATSAAHATTVVSIWLWCTRWLVGWLLGLPYKSQNHFTNWNEFSYTTTRKCREAQRWRTWVSVSECVRECVCNRVWVFVYETLSCRSTKLQWPKATGKSLGASQMKALQLNDFPFQMTL